jgi:hypothetical protein
MLRVSIGDLDGRQTAVGARNVLNFPTPDLPLAHVGPQANFRSSDEIV